MDVEWYKLWAGISVARSMIRERYSLDYLGSSVAEQAPFEPRDFMEDSSQNFSPIVFTRVDTCRTHRLRAPTRGNNFKTDVPLQFLL